MNILYKMVWSVVGFIFPYTAVIAILRPDARTSFELAAAIAFANFVGFVEGRCRSWR